MNKRKKQNETAKELGVSASYISAVLKGKKSCTKEIAQKLTKQYGVQFIKKVRTTETYIIEVKKNE